MTALTRMPVMENLGLALLGVAHAVVAKQYWAREEKHLEALYALWLPRLKVGSSWPPEVYSARAAFEDAYHYAYQSVIWPATMYMMRREVFAIRMVTP